MRFGFVETDVVQLAAIGAARQIALIEERDPLAPERFALRGEKKGVLRFRVARPGEFGRDDGADADSGSEIVTAVAEFDMIALRVLPLCRTCQDDSGSEAGAWLMEWKLKNDCEVPQGHSSTTASGSIFVAV